jgi:hypothetical protein
MEPKLTLVIYLHIKPMAITIRVPVANYNLQIFTIKSPQITNPQITKRLGPQIATFAEIIDGPPTSGSS